MAAPTGHHDTGGGDSVLRGAPVLPDHALQQTGTGALEAMGSAYTELTGADRDRILLMLQCFSGCDDADVREGVRSVWRDLVELAEQRSGEPPEVISAFFAKGMLLNVIASMDLLGADEGWAQRLIEGCRQDG